MEYSINELSKLAGVSARTLRYYDEIGLLKPAYINDAGYFSENIVNELVSQFKTTFAREFPNIAKQIKSA